MLRDPRLVALDALNTDAGWRVASNDVVEALAGLILADRRAVIEEAKNIVGAYSIVGDRSDQMLAALDSMLEEKE